MWKVAIFAWMPIFAVLFGITAIIVTHVPGLTRDFDGGAAALYGGAAASALIAAPLAWLVARRMLARRERRLMDAR